MKSLTLLFAELTRVSGLLALAVAVIFQICRAIESHSEMKRAKATWHTFQLQTRLGKLSTELQELEAGVSFASGLKFQAANLAYDRLLAEACERAGVNVEPQCEYEDVERLRRERALNQLGWVW